MCGTTPSVSCRCPGLSNILFKLSYCCCTQRISLHALSCCYCCLYPCIPRRPLNRYQHIHYLLAIVDYTLVGSATASFKDLVTVTQENYTNQTADILVEDQIRPPLDLVRVAQTPTSQTAELSEAHSLEQIRPLPNSNYKAAHELA